MGPQIRILSLHQVTSLLLEHGIIIGHGDQFEIALSFLIGNNREVWISLLAILANQSVIVVLNREPEKFSQNLEAGKNSSEMMQFTLFDLRKLSGLLFESILILAKALYM